MLDLVIENGILLTPQGLLEASIGIENGSIAEISRGAHLSKAEKRIDAKGKIVMPGVVDPETHIGHVRPLEEDIGPETRAAVATGVTTWGLMSPSTRLGGHFKETTTPEDVVSFHKTLPQAIDLCNNSSFVDTYFTLKLETDQQANEIPEYLSHYGINSFKFQGHTRDINLANRYWFASKTGLGSGFNDGTVFIAMENVAKFSKPGIISFHCENFEISRVLIERYKKAGRKDLAAWSDKTPPFVEAHQVVSWSYLARVTGCPIYIQHVTTQETVNQISNARNQGTDILSQTGPAWLSLSNESWDDGAKINVPLRDKKTREYLWTALASGVIDAVGSDHVASYKRNVFDEDRMNPDVWKAKSGFSSRVESLLPVMLSEGVNKSRITLERLVKVVCENPARSFRIYPKKGAIAVGSDADLVLVDLKKTVKLDSDMVFTSTGWSFYEGRVFTGWPVMTILRGNVMAEWPNGEKKMTIVGKPGTGKYIRRD